MKYIIKWSSKNKPAYYQSESGTTFKKEDAKIFNNRKEAGMSAFKMRSIGYVGPIVVEK